MELLKKDEPLLEYQWKDVTFYVRPRATANDKLELDLGGEIDPTGKVKLSILDGHRLLLRRFVVGWKGVTVDGQEVPYSYEAFINQFPADPASDVILLLGGFIGTKTGIFPTTEDTLKKNA